MACECGERRRGKWRGRRGEIIWVYITEFGDAPRAGETITRKWRVRARVRAAYDDARGLPAPPRTHHVGRGPVLKFRLRARS